VSSIQYPKLNTFLGILCHCVTVTRFAVDAARRDDEAVDVDGARGVVQEAEDVASVAVEVEADGRRQSLHEDHEMRIVVGEATPTSHACTDQGGRGDFMGC
jgi:hypothetical protein